MSGGSVAHLRIKAKAGWLGRLVGGVGVEGVGIQVASYLSWVGVDFVRPMITRFVLFTMKSKSLVRREVMMMTLVGYLKDMFGVCMLVAMSTGGALCAIMFHGRALGLL